MRKEIGKWFLDISKYVVTGVLLTSILGDIQEKQTVYAIGIATVIVTFIIGLFFMKDTKETKNKRRK